MMTLEEKVEFYNKKKRDGKERVERTFRKIHEEKVAAANGLLMPLNEYNNDLTIACRKNAAQAGRSVPPNIIVRSDENAPQSAIWTNFDQINKQFRKAGLNFTHKNPLD